MILIKDKVTGKIINNMGTNSMFPDGNIPNLPSLPEGHEYVRIHDHSDEAKDIMTAYDYEISSDKKVTVKKTLKQYHDEQPSKEKEKTILERLEALEAEVKALKKGG